MVVTSLETDDIHELAAIAVKGLPAREYKILTMRFGLDGEDQRSHTEIARALHLSQSNVAVIEARALRRLRHPLQLAAKLVTSGRLSQADLQRAVEVLSRLRKTTITPEAVAATIKTELPELSSFAESLPKTRVELYAFVQTLVLILTLALAVANHNHQRTSTPITNVFINQPQIERVLSKPTPEKRRAKPKKRVHRTR